MRRGGPICEVLCRYGRVAEIDYQRDHRGLSTRGAINRGYQGATRLFHKFWFLKNPQKFIPKIRQIYWNTAQIKKTTRPLKWNVPIRIEMSQGAIGANNGFGCLPVVYFPVKFPIPFKTFQMDVDHKCFLKSGQILLSMATNFGFPGAHLNSMELAIKHLSRL